MNTKNPNNNAPLEVLSRFLEAHDLPRDAAVMERFAEYLALLERARKRLNLVGNLNAVGIVETLFCDSLQILALHDPPDGPVLGVGSGAGFPGIPIKLVRPELDVVLVEPREKRYRFLGHVVRTLGLSGVTRVRARIEEADVPLAGLACAKAFAPVERWLPMATGLVREGGRVAILVSKADWEARGLPAVAALGGGWTVEAERTYRWGTSPERVAALVAPGS